MARDFGTASGQGLTTSACSPELKGLTTLSFAFWMSRDSGGSGTAYGRVIYKGNGEDWNWYNDNGSAGWGMGFVAGNWTTNNGVWSIGYPDTAWHHYVVTYDYGSTSNDPIIYKDGVSQTITERITPSGTVAADDDYFSIGNKPSTTGGWDGKIAEVGVWNRILTASEASLLSKAYSPLFIPDGLVSCVPVIGRNSPEIDLVSGVSLTLQGTPPYIDHPRIIYPSSSQIRTFGGAAAPTTETITKSLKYTVIKSISTTKSLKYSVQIPSPITKSLKYIVTTSSTIQKSLSYYVAVATTMQKSLEYIVTAPASVTKSLKYTVLAETSVTKSLSYEIISDTAITKTLTYHVRQFVYSREDSATLGTDDSDLDNAFTNQEYEDVEVDDSVRVPQLASNNAVFLFKVRNNSQTGFTITIDLQTDKAPSTETVFLQVYNRTTTTWETIDSNNTASVDTDFTLTGTITTNPEDYFDVNNYVACRVYQS